MIVKNKNEEINNKNEKNVNKKPTEEINNKLDLIIKEINKFLKFI